MTPADAAGFSSRFTTEVSDIHDFPTLSVKEPGYVACAARLRGLIKSKLLLYSDIVSAPEKFFLAHRLLVDPKMRGP